MVTSKPALDHRWRRGISRFGKRFKRVRKPNINPEVEQNNTLLTIIWNTLKEKIIDGDFKKITFTAKFIGRKIEKGYEIKNLKMEAKNESNQ